MKKITNLLQKNNLTPRERILMCIHNDITEMRTGKRMLSSADLEAISSGWKPRTHYEVAEYNRYYEVWDAIKFLDLDAQTMYLNAVISIKDIQILLMYFSLKGIQDTESFFDKLLGEEGCEKAHQELLKNTGLNYEELIHRLTFLSLSKDTKEDLLALDSESQHDPTYLNEEEKLYSILKDKTSLTDIEIEKLTEILFDAIPWRYEEVALHKGVRIIDLVYHAYFASYPIFQFFKELAKKVGIQYESDDELKEKLSLLPNLKQQLRDVMRETIRDGLFINDYTPLCNSNGHITYSGTDTKLSHAEVFEEWIQAKKQIKKEIQEHINDGILILEERVESILGVTGYVQSIIGESLYYCKKDLSFVQEYRQQVDTNLTSLGRLVYYFKKHEFLKWYEHLLAYRELLGKASKLFNNEDITFMAEKHIDSIKEQVELMNQQLGRIVEKFTDDLYTHQEHIHPVDVYLDGMYIDLETLRPIKHKSQKILEEKTEPLFPGFWQRS